MIVLLISALIGLNSKIYVTNIDKMGYSIKILSKFNNYTLMKNAYESFISEMNKHDSELLYAKIYDLEFGNSTIVSKLIIIILNITIF